MYTLNGYARHGLGYLPVPKILMCVRVEEIVTKRSSKYSLLKFFFSVPVHTRQKKLQI